MIMVLKFPSGGVRKAVVLGRAISLRPKEADRPEFGSPKDT
jgi:ABC-type transporter Mla maintaining outer membrane lipid asymmetry ATPase subunit MlaF